MSGNHNQAQTTHSEPPTALDIEQMASWREHWDKSWRDRLLHVTHNERDKGSMAILCHDIHKQAFYDGFAARLSGVKDE